MRTLIVNADDFGLGPGINAGIARAAAEGILTSVSLMANGPALAGALSLLPDWPHVSPGAHLALVGGRPVAAPSDVPSLVDDTGHFPHGYRDFLRLSLRGRIRGVDVYREWSAQVRLLQERGVALTHLDSHQHLHALPWLLPIALRIAREAGIPAIRLPLERGGRPTTPDPKTALIALACPGDESPGYAYEAPSGLEQPASSGFRRNSPVIYRRASRTGEPDPNSISRRPRPEALLLRAAALLARPRLRRAGVWSPDHFVGFADSGRMTVDVLARHLEALRPGVTELMTHPGLQDPTVRAGFPQPYLWEAEVAALTAPDTRLLLEQRQITLVSYRTGTDKVTR